MKALFLEKKIIPCFVDEIVQRMRIDDTITPSYVIQMHQRENSLSRSMTQTSDRIASHLA